MLAGTETITCEKPPAGKSGVALEAALAVAAAENPMNGAPSALDALEQEVRAAEVDWSRNADLTDQVKAERQGREITAEDERLWNAASDRHWSAVDALTNYRPRTAAEMLRKAQLLTNDGDTRLRTEEQFADVYLADAAAACEMALDAVAQMPNLRPAWDAAFAAYEQRRAEHEALTARWEAVYQGIVNRAPDWNKQARPCDGQMILIWQGVKQYDFSMSSGRGSADGRSRLVAWVEAEADRLAEMDRLGGELDELFNVLCDAERRVIETPAPDLAAVVTKQRMFGRETDDQKRGYQDPAYYAACRDDSAIIRSWPVHIHEDVLRLAGIPDPVLTRKHFTPRQWLKAFRAQGGDVCWNEKKRVLDFSLPVMNEAVIALMQDIGEDRSNIEALRLFMTEDY